MDSSKVIFQGREIHPPLNPMPAHKTSAKRAVSQMLRALPQDELLQHELLYWLFYWHPSRDRKLQGRHIQGFVLRPFMRAYTPFAQMQEGGDMVDFSYTECIEGFYGGSGEEKAARDNRRDVQQAFRYAITPDIWVWRGQHGDAKPSKDAVVDHAYPDTFSSLTDEFLRRWSAWDNYGRADGWGFYELFIRSGGDWLVEPYYPVQLLEGTRQTLFQPVIADPEMREMWIDFHREFARLRWLTPEQNAKCGCLRDAFPEIVGHGLYLALLMSKTLPAPRSG